MLLDEKCFYDDVKPASEKCNDCENFRNCGVCNNQLHCGNHGMYEFSCNPEITECKYSESAQARFMEKCNKEYEEYKNKNTNEKE